MRLNLSALAAVLFISVQVSAETVRLQVPVVKQAQASLNSAAAIEMLFRYWGENRHDQYAIAGAIARKFARESSFRRSGFKAGSTDWASYPTLPQYIVYRFLRRYERQESIKVGRLARSTRGRARQFDRSWFRVQKRLRGGLPVLIMQSCTAKGRLGCYRLLTGFDETKRVAYLNDPLDGRIAQSYDELRERWAFDQHGMPFWYTAFFILKGNGPPYDL